MYFPLRLSKQFFFPSGPCRPQTHQPLKPKGWHWHFGKTNSEKRSGRGGGIIHHKKKVSRPHRRPVTAVSAPSSAPRGTERAVGRQSGSSRTATFQRGRPAFETTASEAAAGNLRGRGRGGGLVPPRRSLRVGGRPDLWGNVFHMWTDTLRAAGCPEGRRDGGKEGGGQPGANAGSPLEQRPKSVWRIPSNSGFLACWCFFLKKNVTTQIT